ncbi:SDR family NAD(P)-dependent oxidoreductase [uncultured Slackia sp.]|uniref:SDR family NAD(P)-dependent oxidoreductase n=1 Tax=uncultured Slackia sp. TaxID=665903 RepID=UPI0026DD1B21|nr:SDR family oxidoreductase [uncultured Slackia sp.]MDO5800878.1 SDR family oxidoreductase [Coriobacteriia bacterium]
MKSERAAFFDEAIVSGPGQKEFEERIYAESQAKHWPRVPEGTGKFDGQVAIVTGAAGGQGEIEAKMFAQQGAKVYMVDVVEEGLKRVEANILADGGEAVAVVMDVADEEGWQNLVARIKEECGRLDVLVNNAGICQNGSVLTETRESLERIMDVDCWGVFNGMHYCAPSIIESGGGAIVNTCSYQGTHFGPGNFVGYAMAKAAAMGMTRAAATDLGALGVRVNSVNPGLILSGMTLPRGQNRKGLCDASSLKRYGMPEEIASVALFLASDDASFINGEFISADGGATTYLHLATADKN